MNTFPEIVEQAERELAAEKHRAAVEKAKARILAEKWWHKFVPFKIVIIRR